MIWMVIEPLRKSRTTVRLSTQAAMYLYLEGIIQADTKQDIPANENKSMLSGWWFGTFFIFPYIGLLIIPIDVHIFSEGFSPTTNQLLWVAKNWQCSWCSHDAMLTMCWGAAMTDDLWHGSLDPLGGCIISYYWDHSKAALLTKEICIEMSGMMLL